VNCKKKSHTRKVEKKELRKAKDPGSPPPNNFNLIVKRKEERNVCNDIVNKHITSIIAIAAEKKKKDTEKRKVAERDLEMHSYREIN
jgi:hypothetical protein